MRLACTNDMSVVIDKNLKDYYGSLGESNQQQVLIRFKVQRKKTGQDRFLSFKARNPKKRAQTAVFKQPQIQYSLKRMHL